MATQRPVCPLCGDTKVVRADGMSAGCPFHGDAGMVHMDSAASARIRASILEHARANPQDTVGEEPPGWQAVAGDPGRSCRALGGLLVATSSLVLLAILVTLVVLW